MIWNKNMKQTKVDEDWELGITTEIRITIAKKYKLITSTTSYSSCHSKYGDDSGLYHLESNTFESSSSTINSPKSPGAWTEVTWDC